VSNSNNEHDTDKSHLIDKRIFSANKTLLPLLESRFHVPPTHHSTTDATPKADVKHDLMFHSICEGNSFYVHFIPSFLHSIAIGYMMFLYWLNHDEQLQNLMERVKTFFFYLHVCCNFLIINNRCLSKQPKHNPSTFLKKGF
jgi:hypothetical protein